MIKKCYSCQKEKKLECFYKRSDGYEGYRHICIECWKIKNSLRTPIIEKECKKCKNIFVGSKKTKYCNKCKYTKRSNKNNEYVKCVICFNVFLKKRGHICCSSECSRINHIKKGNISKQKRVNNDPSLRLHINMSRAIRSEITSHNKKKNMSIFEMLSYSPQDLKKHLEKQFEPWMNWENYGPISLEKRTWNIDHIIPRSKLPYDSMEHPNFQKCWGLENLRPLDAIENIKKRDK